jgi:hypothetical protein
MLQRSAAYHQSLPKRQSRQDSDTPTTKKLKKSHELMMQKMAFDDLSCLRAANDGKHNYGEIEMVVAKYVSSGFEFVTCRNLTVWCSIKMDKPWRMIVRLDL